MIIFIDLSIIYLLVLIKYLLPLFRDAPEATGDEPEDADFETPKVYELVRTHQCSYQRFLPLSISSLQPFFYRVVYKYCLIWTLRVLEGTAN